ncbi:hypothetical protein BH10BAC1_BH10BAC1_07870 [soil metagenome]
MKRIKIFIAIVSVIAVASCGNDTKITEPEVSNIPDPKTELSSKIQNLESEMHSSMQLDNEKAAQALVAYSEYAKLFPSDSITPDYLFKAGEIATATQQYPQAVDYYKTISEKYPNYKLVQESLFLQAAVLDNFIDDDVKAKVIYEALIAKYPQSTYANDAKAAIKNLGKTDAELIKEFQKKNGEK